MTLSLTINETLKWLSSLPILMQESFWWWQCSDRYILSLFPHLHTTFPPFSTSLISLVVSVDVKHHVYFCCGFQQLLVRTLSLWLQSCSAQPLKEAVAKYRSCFALARDTIWGHHRNTGWWLTVSSVLAGRRRARDEVPVGTRITVRERIKPCTSRVTWGLNVWKTRTRKL